MNIAMLNSLKTVYDQCDSQTVTFTKNGFDAELSALSDDKFEEIKSIEDIEISDEKGLPISFCQTNPNESLKIYVRTNPQKEKLYFRADDLIREIFENPVSFQFNKNSLAYYFLTDNLGMNVELENLEALGKLVNFLSNKFYFSQNPAQLVIFSKSVFILQSGSYSTLRKRLETAFSKTEGFDLCVNRLLSYFNEDDRHQSENKIILAQAIESKIESYTANTRYEGLIKNFESIINEFENSYKLYINNFNYENFLSIFEAKYEDLVEKITKIISQIQTQLFGIPIAFLAALLLKPKLKDENFFWFLTNEFIAYYVVIFICVLVGISTYNFWNNVNFLENTLGKVDSHEIPEEIRIKKQKQLDAVKRQISLARIYIGIGAVMIILIALLTISKLTQT